MYLVRRNHNNYLDWPSFVNRHFGNFWNETEEDSVVWKPRMDVKETKEAYELLADLPGLSKKDINISLNDDVLTVKGERKTEEKKEDEDRYYAERTFGSFSRSFKLPTKVASEKIKAEYKNGVLRLTLPKAEEAKPHEITVQ
jgi:HSP20 family protein